MFLQVDPGSGGAPLAKKGFTIPVSRTLTDVDVDEILSSLDADTRDYVRLLANGAGHGLQGRGTQLAEVFRRFEPTVRDLARVNGSVAKERRALRRLINSFARLNGELATKGPELAGLVDASAKTFRAFASEDVNLSRTVSDLPGTLRQASSTLLSVRRFADQLGPTAGKLVPAVRALNRANKQVRPFARASTPVLRDQIRPFVREARPLLADLRPAATALADATPDLTRSFVVLNHLFNMLGYNQNGREDPGVSTRDEGYLFWIAWVTHQTINLINVDDANGPLRPVFLTGSCSTLQSIAANSPLVAFGLNLGPILAGPC
jgi:phospholipid/cholesterol/gamma-HCH transport system substrate-binding protein